MKTYTVKDDYSASSNTIVDLIDISSFVDTAKYSVKKAWINVGGWQSWNPGFEVEPGKKQDSLTCHLIKGWNKYLVFPETEFTPSKNIVLGQFVTYLRWDDFYLVFANLVYEHLQCPYTSSLYLLTLAPPFMLLMVRVMQTNRLILLVLRYMSVHLLVHCTDMDLQMLPVLVLLVFFLFLEQIR